MSSPAYEVLFFDPANAEHVYRADDRQDAEWYVDEWKRREVADPIGLVPAIVERVQPGEAVQA